MNNTNIKSQELKQNIKTTNHPQIIKSINYWAVITSNILLALGAACLFLPQYAIGATLIVLGIILLLVKYKRNVYEKTGSAVKYNSYFFAKEKLAGIENLLSLEDIQNAKPVKFESTGGAKIEYMASGDKQFLAVQLFDYKPFVFEPVSPILYFTESKATDLINFFEKCKVF